MIFIALGGNLDGEHGDVIVGFRQAMISMANKGIVPVRSSYIYKSAPVGPPQPDYFNAVIRVRSCLSPIAVLNKMHEVEHEFGRFRREKWGPRTLDLDLIDYNGYVLEQKLVIPHPRLADRAFVLLPLRDICPSWRHPKTGESIDQLVCRLPTKAKMSIHQQNQRIPLAK